MSNMSELHAELTGHSKACLAHAVQCALENLRDLDTTTSASLIDHLASDTLVMWAATYLDPSAVGDEDNICQCGYSKRTECHECFARVTVVTGGPVRGLLSYVHTSACSEA